MESVKVLVNKLDGFKRYSTINELKKNLRAVTKENVGPMSKESADHVFADKVNLILFYNDSDGYYYEKAYMSPIYRIYDIDEYVAKKAWMAN